MMGATMMAVTTMGATMMHTTAMAANAIGDKLMGATAIGATMLRVTAMGANTMDDIPMGATNINATTMGVTTMGDALMGATMAGPGTAARGHSRLRTAATAGGLGGHGRWPRWPRHTTPRPHQPMPATSTPAQHLQDVAVATSLPSMARGVASPVGIIAPTHGVRHPCVPGGGSTCGP